MTSSLELGVCRSLEPGLRQLPCSHGCHFRRWPHGGSTCPCRKPRTQRPQGSDGPRSPPCPRRAQPLLLILRMRPRGLRVQETKKVAFQKGGRVVGMDTGPPPPPCFLPPLHVGRIPSTVPLLPSVSWVLHGGGCDGQWAFLAVSGLNVRPGSSCSRCASRSLADEAITHHTWGSGPGLGPADCCPSLCPWP